jgi:hypothetical protein
LIPFLEPPGKAGTPGLAPGNVPFQIVRRHPRRNFNFQFFECFMIFSKGGSKSWICPSAAVPNAPDDNAACFDPIENLMRSNDNLSYVKAVGLTFAHARREANFFTLFLSPFANTQRNIVAAFCRDVA